MMPEGFAIRPFRLADAAGVAGIFHRAVEGIAPRHYTPGQIAAWLSDPPTAQSVAEDSCDGRQVFVVADGDDKPVAYIDLEPDGHIDMLFCLPEAAGRGLGSALCVRVEQAARQAGMTRRYVEASELAKPVFQRHGFSVLARRDFDLAGAAVHNYAMEKRL